MEFVSIVSKHVLPTYRVMSLITVTKADTRVNWRGKELIDGSKKGKKMMINTEDIKRVEGWSGGAKIFLADGEVLVVKESIDELSRD